MQNNRINLKPKNVGDYCTHVNAVLVLKLNLTQTLNVNLSSFLQDHDLPLYDTSVRSRP